MPEALAELQGWMLDGILAGAAEGIAERIAGDARLGPQGRFAIYAGGYRSRLLETLRDDFPALRLLVGETVFDLFAHGYIAARPPRHFSLYDYGAGFAEHLEATRPEGGRRAAGGAAGGGGAARTGALGGAARRGRGARAEPPLMADAAMLPGLRLRLPDSVRLLRLDFDLLPLIEASERGGGRWCRSRARA